eukprot:CAMPEP_0175950334 /NCGR_PEP_ID=MMETSP0108-20121206/29544_1 /TAXON_ID=195067 ORGANISM="Goniomonas pacifica, Strain CCMP1869" /NCGR_SAMPLE_ID=MMETSP0108 /ASSEMBLY_ACC=CAM_ASM_000204 /LENGTH=162 /DNA_ID=CAMNT_0017276385 /DNA_START=13 /DNA_END=497 /DNA_ORIENTATION=-
MSDCRPWWSVIDDRLVLGAIPLADRGHLGQLLDLGVTAVVTLNQTSELQPNLVSRPVTPSEWVAAGVTQFRQPTADFSGLTFDSLCECVAFMRSHEEQRSGQGSRIYVHCKAGRGRAPTVMACFLIAHRGATTAQALALLSEKRPAVWLLPGQRRAIEDFET